MTILDYTPVLRQKTRYKWLVTPGSAGRRGRRRRQGGGRRAGAELRYRLAPRRLDLWQCRYLQTYGNVGTSKRLDFTVIHSAVNEASRIESLSKTLNRQILISAAFRDSMPDALVSLGHHDLCGVAGEREIFGLPAA